MIILLKNAVSKFFSQINKGFVEKCWDELKNSKTTTTVSIFTFVIVHCTNTCSYTHSSDRFTNGQICISFFLLK